MPFSVQPTVATLTELVGGRPGRGDHARALSLALDARATLEHLGPFGKKHLETLNQWLRAQPRPSAPPP